jgi:hypothetical protein
MNEEIETIFANFKVNNINIPVNFLDYNGNKNTYIVYMETDKDNSYSGDNEILGFVDYYDFDIYSKGNYLEVVREVKRLLKENGWTWQPSRDSEDMYETDTGFYHKTLCFAKQVQINN